jgi:HlyD family secretion protein
MKRKWLYIAAAVFFGALIILAIGKNQGWIGKEDVIKISTEKAGNRDIVEIVTANGKIQPELELIITPDVSGEIVELTVKEGDKVKKGQLLAKIDPEIYMSTLERMEATLNTQKANLANSQAMEMQSKAQYLKSKSDYDRSKKLAKKGAISDADLETAKANYESSKASFTGSQKSVLAAKYNVKSSQAALKEARLSLNKTSIYAPMDGTVSRLSKELGERVVGTSQFEGTEIMRIADLTRMEVNVEVGENDIVRVSHGDTAIIEVDAFQDRKFKGIVTEIANSAKVTGIATEQVTNFEVKISVLRESYMDLIPKNNPEGSPFRPGMSATVDVRTEIKSGILTIPIQAVTTRKDTVKTSYLDKAKKDDRPKTKEEKEKEKKDELAKLKEYVFVYKNGVARIRQVETGIQDDEYMEILDGLKEGEEVITAPYSAVSRKLESGNKVEKVAEDQLYDKD